MSIGLFSGEGLRSDSAPPPSDISEERLRDIKLVLSASAPTAKFKERMMIADIMTRYVKYSGERFAAALERRALCEFYKVPSDNEDPRFIEAVEYESKHKLVKKHKDWETLISKETKKNDAAEAAAKPTTSRSHLTSTAITLITLLQCFNIEVTSIEKPRIFDDWAMTLTDMADLYDVIKTLCQNEEYIAVAKIARTRKTMTFPKWRETKTRAASVKRILQAVLKRSGFKLEAKKRKDPETGMAQRVFTIKSLFVREEHEQPFKEFYVSSLTWAPDEYDFNNGQLVVPAHHVSDTRVFVRVDCLEKIKAIFIGSRPRWAWFLKGEIACIYNITKETAEKKKLEVVEEVDYILTSRPKVRYNLDETRIIDVSEGYVKTPVEKYVIESELILKPTFSDKALEIVSEAWDRRITNGVMAKNILINYLKNYRE
jgi:hypothetical protein